MKLKTVLIGCGAISNKHVAAISANSGRFELVGAFDIDGDRVATIAAETGARAYTAMTAMADDFSPEVAAIATPSALHADQAVFWMERGAHLVLEKPIALSTKDISRIRTTAEKTGRKVAVGYVLRYAPHIRLLARALAEGRFGTIFHVGLSVYWNRNDEYYTSAAWRGTWRHDGGTLMNQATHGIDLLQWLLGGKPTAVSGSLGRYLRPIEADDFAAAMVQFADGGLGTINVTVDTYPRNLGTRLTILGEHGTVELSGNGPDAITTWKFPEDSAWAAIDAAVADGLWTPEAGVVTGLSGHAGVYEDLALSIENDSQPIASLETGAVSAEIVLGIQQSHRERKRVSFPVDFATADMTGTEL